MQFSTPNHLCPVWIDELEIAAPIALIHCEASGIGVRRIDKPVTTQTALE